MPLLASGLCNSFDTISPPSTMSSQPPQNPAAVAGPTTTGTTPRPLGSSSESKTDWLANSLLTAKIVTAAADSVPLPYVKGVFGTVVVLLETVEKLKKNQDDLKDLCEDVMEIIDVVQGLSTQQDTPAVQFKKKCDEFQGALQVIVAAVNKMQTKPKGLCRHLKEIIKLGSTTDAITGYRSRMQELRLNFMLMNTTDTNLRLRKVQESFAAMSFNGSGLKIAESTNNCPSPSRIFEGRRVILDGMHQYFFQTTGKQHIYLLYGLGGAGKTQIALKFIEESSSHFSNTFFIDTSTVETIDTGLKNIALAKNMTPNSISTNFSLNVIMATFSSHLETLSFVVMLEDITLSLIWKKPDAVELLLKSAVQNGTPENRETAVEVVKVLWYLPLAIIQAGAFILKSGALNTYLALYAANKERLLREKPAQSHDDYAWTVYTTWQISFDQLKDELQMPLEFLSQFLTPTGVWDSLCFMNVITEIRAYSLINFDVMKKLFSIHPLVHDWSQTTLTDQESHHDCMIAIVGMTIATMPKTNIEVDSLRLLPHLDALLNRNIHIICDFGAEYANIYNYAHKYRQAETLEIAVLEKQRHILGEDHLATLTAMHNLAQTYHNMGKLEKAEKLQVVVLEKRKTVLGEDHPGTLIAMNNLASIYYALGKLKEGEKLQVVVVEKQKTVLGEDHPNTLIAMSWLAKTYYDVGKLEEAEKLGVTVVEKRKTVLGEDHPSTLTAMNNLASTYYALVHFIPTSFKMS
ncbi:hypothetical protein C8R44DRAFT_863011 [Mycena epipterygia]|nr:hypothetical protein C8R44DRAFT_863011 [Mycena epipterygia]